MAGVIKTVIETLFTTRGADEAAGAADRVGRAQTRLGNSSTGAGRQFATQSAGLGGLVAAYAGAAATSFALSAAFDALAKSAMSAQTIEGVSTLASNMGQDGSKILSTVREITNSQLTLAATAEQVNLALSAGFSTKQIEGLATVATKASKALGRDLADSMTRLVRGSAKMEAELIDELGLYTKIGPSTTAYAASIGKATSSLTDYERRQAFVNAVLAEGDKKFSSISTTIPTAAGKLQAFSSKIQDLAQQFGSLLANFIAPLADFLTNNAGAAFSAFGIILSLVASKGVQALETGLMHLTESINNAGIRAEGFIRGALGIGKATRLATTAVKELDLATLKLTEDQKAQVLGLQTTAKARSLVNGELKKASDLVGQSRSTLQSEITTREAANTVLKDATAAKLRDQQATKANFIAAKANVDMLKAQGANTQAVTDAEKARASAQGSYGAATRALNVITTNNNASIAANTAIIDANKAAIVGHDQTITKLNGAKSFRGTIASLATGMTKFATGSLSIFTGGITSAVGAASKLMFISSMFVMIGSSIAEATGKGAEFQAFLKGAGAAIKGFLGGSKKADAANVFQGINAKSLSDLEAVDSKLKDLDKFTFTTKSYGVTVKIDKTKEELSNEVSSLMAEAVAGPKTIGTALTSGRAMGVAAGVAVVGAIIGGVAAAGTTGGMGVVAGAALGRNIGMGVGYGIGTIWDYLTPDDAAVPPEIAAKIKQQYASLFEGIAPEGQDKMVSVISKIQDKYGAAAKVDPGAAAAMKLQIDLVRESAKYMGNVQVISELMIATGKTADQIIKVFNFDTAQSQIDYIHRAFMDIGSKKLTFSFIDSESPQIKKILDLPLEAKIYTDQIQSKLSDMISSQSGGNLDYSNMPDSLLQTVDMVKELQNIMDSTNVGLDEAIVQVQTVYTGGIRSTMTDLRDAGINIQDVFNLVTHSIIDESASLASAIGAFNAFAEQSSRLGNVQGTLNNSIADGSITLEGYSQSLGNARSALIETVRAQVSSKSALDSLQGTYDELNKAGETDRANALLPILANMRLQYNIVSQTLEVQRAINKELADQDSHVRSQVEIYDFLNSFKKQEKNKLNVELDFITAGAKPEEVLLKSLQYLQNFKSVQLESMNISQQQVDSYDAQSKALAGVDLQAGEIGKILDSTNIDEAKKKIDGLGLGLKTTIVNLPGDIDALKITATSGAEAIFRPLDKGIGQVIGIYKAAEQAQQELIRQSVEALPAFIDAGLKEFKTGSDNFKKEMADIASKGLIATVKFTADISGLQESLQQQISQNGISVAEANLKVAQSTRGGDVVGATQNLVDMQKKLIDDQVAAAKTDYSNKVAIINVQNKASKDALIAETALQVQKLEDNRKQVAITAALAVDMGDTMVSAGNSIGAGIVEAFNEGARVIKAALGSEGGGTVIRGTYTAPKLPNFAGDQATMLDTAKKYDEANKASQTQLENLRDAKTAELDLGALREKSVLAQTTMNSLYGIYSNKFNADNNTLSEIVAKEHQKTQELKDQLKLTQMQSAINIMSAQNILSATQNANSIAGSEHQLELSRQGLSNLQTTHGIEIQRIKDNNELLDIQTQIANIKGGGNAAQDKAQLESIQNQTKLNAAQYELVRMERDVSSTQREIEDKKRANIELEKKILEDNYKNQVAAIKASGNGQAAATKIQLESLDRQAALIEVERGLKQEEHIRVQAQFAKETTLMLDKIKADITKADNDWKIVAATKLLDENRLIQQKQAAQQEYNNTLAQITAIDTYWDATSSFVDGIATFAGIVREFILAQHPEDSAAARRLDDLQSSLPNMVKPDSAAAKQALEDSKAASDASFAAQQTQIDKIGELNAANYLAQRQGLEDQLKYTSELREMERQGLITQQQAEMMAFDHEKKMIDLNKEKAKQELAKAGGGTAAELAQAKATFDQAMQGLDQQAEDLAYTAGKIGPILKSIKEGIGSSFTDALVGLNSSLFDTTDTVKSFGERLRDAFFGIMKGIEEQVFKETIANPIGTFISEWIGTNILGKIAAKTAASTVGDVGGAAAVAGLGATVSTASTGAVASINAAAASLGAALGTLGTSVGGSAQGAGAQAQAGGIAGATAISGSGTILAGATQTSSGVVATANTAGATTLMASLGPILAVLAVIAAIMAIFGGKKGGASKSNVAAEERAKALAQSNTNTFGSVPQMASGGMMRDRFPALLEPGEFVIRKPMAKRIGASNLAQMNATGKTANSAPVINIKNEGSPKNAEASQPRFDGEKYVIDIIMRDLSNNGPIRRSLRGGV